LIQRLPASNSGFWQFNRSHLAGGFYLLAGLKTLLRPMSDPKSITVIPAMNLKSLRLDGGAHGVLLFHGLSSGPMELQFVARGLQRAGYSVVAPVIAGYTHGLPCESGQKTGAKEWIASALREFDALAERCETVSVGGLCIGAVLSLRLAALRANRISSVLAMSTALHFDGWANPWYTHLLSLARYLPFARRIAINEGEPYGLKDTRMRAWVKRQMQVSGDSSAGAAVLMVDDLLKARDLIALAKASLTQVTSPLLLIHAREDECASPKSSYEVANQVKASRIEILILTNSYHMVSLDQEKNTVIAAMIGFLSEDAKPAVKKVLAVPPTVLSEPLQRTPLTQLSQLRPAIQT
jgi:carboxylesterase